MRDHDSSSELIFAGEIIILFSSYLKLQHGAIIFHTIAWLPQPTGKLCFLELHGYYRLHISKFLTYIYCGKPQGRFTEPYTTARWCPYCCNKRISKNQFFIGPGSFLGLLPDCQIFWMRAAPSQYKFTQSVQQVLGQEPTHQDFLQPPAVMGPMSRADDHDLGTVSSLLLSRASTGET